MELNDKLILMQKKLEFKHMKGLQKARGNAHYRKIKAFQNLLHQNKLTFSFPFLKTS